MPNRTITVGVRFSPNEMDYVRLYAQRAEKLPAGWCHEIIRQHIIKRVQEEQHNNARDTDSVSNSGGSQRLRKQQEEQHK